MLGNYKKIAIINTSQQIKVASYSSEVNNKVSFNLGFKPSEVFIVFKPSFDRALPCILSSKYHNSLHSPFKASNLIAYIKNVSEKGLDINTSWQYSNGCVMYLERIIAIE